MNDHATSPAQSIPPTPQVGDSLDDVYRLRLGAIWRRLKAEPLYFWLFCGYLFFEFFRPQGIFPVIDFFPWARTLILGAFFLVLFAERESKSLSGPLTLPLLAFMGVVFASIPFAFDPSYSMLHVGTMINWILVYLLFLWVVNSKFRFYIVLAILFLASLKLAQHGFRVSLARGFGYASWGIRGPAGWFENAADLGVQMAIFTAWAVAIYLGLRKYWDYRIVRWAFAFAPIAGAITAMGIGQRNTAVAFVAMGLALLLITRNRIRNLLIVLVAGAALFIIMPEDYKARFDTAGTDDTSESRLTYWEYGMRIYADHPVIGVGFNNWAPYTTAQYPEMFVLGRFEVAHSVPVTLAVETGTLGLITYFWLVLAVFLTNLRSARLLKSADPPFWRYIAIALNVGLAGFLGAGMFLSIVIYPFLWFQAGLTAALYKIAVQESQRGPDAVNGSGGQREAAAAAPTASPRPFVAK
jgi:putative inorganic carbon (hco3(-)) transporter